MYFWIFSYGKCSRQGVQMGMGYFFGLHKFQIFFGVLVIPGIYGGKQ